MAKHRRRMRSIGRYNDPLLMALARRDMEQLKDNPEYEASMKKKWKKTKAVFQAQYENGIGFLTDETIRTFLLEYNIYILYCPENGVIL